MLVEGVSIDHAPGKYGFAGEPTISETGMITRYHQMGGNVSISTDGDGIAYSQMLEATRAAYLMHLEAAADNRVMSPSDILAMGTSSAARAVGRQRDVGSLEPGKQADFFVFRADDFPYLGVRHKLLMFMMYASHYAVEDVFVAGRRVVAEGTTTLVDEAAAQEDFKRALTSFRKRVFGAETSFY